MKTINDAIEGTWTVTSILQRTTVGTIRLRANDYEFKPAATAPRASQFEEFVPYLARHQGRYELRYADTFTSRSILPRPAEGSKTIASLIFPAGANGTNTFRIVFDSKLGAAKWTPDFSAIPTINNPYEVHRSVVTKP